MKHYMKICLKMTLTHVCVQVCTLLLGTAIMGAMLNNSWGSALLSVLASALYMGFIYRNAWNVAKLDIKPYSVNKSYAFKGGVLATPILLVNAILVVLWLIKSPTMIEMHDVTAFAIDRVLVIWNFNAYGFMNTQSAGMGAFYWIAIFAFCPIASTFGYIAGMKKYNIVDRLIYPMVYKKKDK